jgi:hypothetical protein
MYRILQLGKQRPAEPLSPEAVVAAIANEVVRQLPWVTRVDVTSDTPGVYLVDVQHTYPDGIQLDAWIRPCLQKHLGPAAHVDVTYERVQPVPQVHL